MTVPRDESRRAEQKAENERLQKVAVSALPPSMTIETMLEDCIWISAGSMVGRVSNPGAVLTYGEFSAQTAACVTFVAGENGKEKPIPTASLWKRHPKRKTVFARTFRAGAGVICTDPEGQPALNSWRQIKRGPSKRDVQPFLEQIEYLFPDAADREAFLCWLAHIEQRPGVLPHWGWLHIASNTGTGRNWLASVLARLWRGYVAPNVDLPALLDSPFNGQLSGRVLAIVDEVQEAAGDNPYRHSNKLKSLVNAEFRDVNPKYGRQYREHNSARWLVFSNHENALPLNDTDRRWRVVKHGASPRSPQAYLALYALLDDAEFINSVGVFLGSRDIRKFNPGERPPLTDAKRAAVEASKSLVQKHAEQLVTAWPADVITNADAAALMSDGAENRITPAMRRALEDARALSVPEPLWISTRNHRAWIIRNHQRWATASPSELAREVSRARSFQDRDLPALALLARGTAQRGARP